MPNSKGEPFNIASGKVTAITSDLLAEVVCDAFRRHVGLGKQWSTRTLAEATGIDSRTLEGYRNGKIPLGEKLWRVMAVLGPAFTSEILSPGAHCVEADGIDGYKLNSQVGSMAATLGKALEDGHIDASEHRAMVPTVRELKVACCRYLTQHAGPKAVA
jgi:transcriptional regulator with XRE-family HTH domain